MPCWVLFNAPVGAVTQHLSCAFWLKHKTKGTQSENKISPAFYCFFQRVSKWTMKHFHVGQIKVIINTILETQEIFPCCHFLRALHSFFRLRHATWPQHTQRVCREHLISVTGLTPKSEIHIFPLNCGATRPSTWFWCAEICLFWKYDRTRWSYFLFVKENSRLRYSFLSSTD